MVQHKGWGDVKVHHGSHAMQTSNLLQLLTLSSQLYMQPGMRLDLLAHRPMILVSYTYDVVEQDILNTELQPNHLCKSAVLWAGY